MKIEQAIKQKEFVSPVQKVIVNILYTQVWYAQRQLHLFKPYGISFQQFNVLRILRGQHPNTASVKLISDRMIDKSSNVSRLVDKLKKKELITRKTSAGDRRQVDISISKKGLKLLETLDAMLEEDLKELNTLSNTELEKLSDLLDRFRLD